MLKEKLDALKAKVFNISKCSVDEFDTLWKLSITDDYNLEERITCLRIYCEVFWMICIKYGDSDKCGMNINQMIEFVNFVATNEEIINHPFYENKEDMFVRFLYWLMHRTEEYTTKSKNVKNFMKFYNKLHDVLDMVKWIFSLELEDGKRVFPIQRLIEDVAIDFQLDEEHYLQLVFSLQLFNDVIDEGSTRDVVRDKMLKIANEHNIELIKLLCNDGKILYGKSASLNGALNGTIVVKTSTQVLIRNISQNYFDDFAIIQDYAGRIEYEGEDKENPIAYYFIYDVNQEKKIVDFQYIMSKTNCNCRQEMLNELLNSKIFNVFMGGAFFIDCNSDAFYKVVNPFGYKDDSVIVSGKNIDGKTPYEKFWNVISNELAPFGMAQLVTYGSIDVLTLDFFVEFSKKLGDSTYNYLSDIINVPANDYYQNLLFKSYFDRALRTDQLISSLGKYVSFLREYLYFDTISTETSYLEHNKLIFPYVPFVPFDGEIEKLFDAFEANEYIKNGRKVCLEIKKEGRKKKYYVEGCEIKAEDILDFSAVPIIESEIIQGYGLFVDEAKTLYLLNDKGVVSNQLNFIKKLAKESIIGVEWRTNSKRIEQLLNVIENIGFADSGRKLGRKIEKTCEQETMHNIALYKLLWHIQYFDFKDNRYDNFEHLILDQYYTDWVLNTNEINQQYFDELTADDSEHRMIVAKESDGEGATLALLYEKFDNGARGALRKAFDGTQIRKNYCSDDNTYLGTQVKDIVFITDNALSGGSTVRMLDFYLKGVIGRKEKRIYLWDKEQNIIPQIVEKVGKDNLCIHVKTIFCTQKAKIKILNSFKDYKIEVTALRWLPNNQYVCTNEILDMVKNLYDEEVDKRAIGNVCLFRPCNMTAECILPDYVKDVTKLIGLFQRKSNKC